MYLSCFRHNDSIQGCELWKRWTVTQYVMALPMNFIKYQRGSLSLNSIILRPINLPWKTDKESICTIHLNNLISISTFFWKINETNRLNLFRIFATQKQRQFFFLKYIQNSSYRWLHCDQQVSSLSVRGTARGKDLSKNSVNR